MSLVAAYKKISFIAGIIVMPGKRNPERPLPGIPFCGMKKKLGPKFTFPKFNLKEVIKMIRTKYVAEIFGDIVKHDLLEDRAGYDIEDLELAYQITEEEASLLKELVTEKVNS